MFSLSVNVFPINVKTSAILRPDRVPLQETTHSIPCGGIGGIEIPRVCSLSYQTKPALCQLILGVLLDINELNDIKAMVDKDHLTHMLDMMFRVDILQRDLVIIKTHTVVGRKERLIFL